MLISISATQFAKGDRVIARIDKDEWYAGTLTKVSRDGKKVTFESNDGEEFHIDGEDLEHIKHISVTGKKSKYSDADAKKLIAKKVDKEKEPVKAKEPTKVTKPKFTIPYAIGEQVRVYFDDGVKGKSVVGDIDAENGLVGVWRGRGNLIWLSLKNVSKLDKELIPKVKSNFKEGDRVIAKFPDGLEGPTVVAAIAEGKVGVWRGRGNIVWLDPKNVKPK